MGKAGFSKLLAHFYGDGLIEEIDGYLVMLGTTDSRLKGDVDYALVALKPRNGETHIRFVDDKKLTGCGNTSAEDSNLPDEIEQKISIYAQ